MSLVSPKTESTFLAYDLVRPNTKCIVSFDTQWLQCAEKFRWQPLRRPFWSLQVLGIPSIAFLAFLVSIEQLVPASRTFGTQPTFDETPVQSWTAKSSLRKLHRFQSHLLTTYYGALWLVAILNTVRVLVQMLEGFSQRHLAIWNTLWLLTRFGEPIAPED